VDYPADGLSVGEDVEMTAVPWWWWFDAGRWRRNGSKNVEKCGKYMKIYKCF
jgi:hypothetical protein